MGNETTAQLDDLLSRFRAGDPDARRLIIERSMARLQTMARRQLKGFPAVRRWEQTDDVLQGAAQRLHRALESVRPGDTREFLALCATMIRRELIDLYRSHYGPQGIGANHASRAKHDAHDTLPSRAHELRAHDTTHDPAKLARWTELHERIDALPPELREVFDLVWYQELTHADAAAIVGVSTKSISRRWREARLAVHKLIEDGEI